MTKRAHARQARHSAPRHQRSRPAGCHPGLFRPLKTCCGRYGGMPSSVCFAVIVWTEPLTAWVSLLAFAPSQSIMPQQVGDPASDSEEVNGLTLCSFVEAEQPLSACGEQGGKGWGGVWPGDFVGAEQRSNEVGARSALRPSNLPWMFERRGASPAASSTAPPHCEQRRAVPRSGTTNIGARPDVAPAPPCGVPTKRAAARFLSP